MPAKQKIFVSDPQYHLLAFSMFFNEENEFLSKEELLLKRDLFKAIQQVQKNAEALDELLKARDKDSGLVLKNWQLSEAEFDTHHQAVVYAHSSIEALTVQIDKIVKRLE